MSTSSESTANEPDAPAAPAITDEAVERLRSRVGVPRPQPVRPHYTVLTADVLRHVAVAYGDDNPLWCDPAYGSGTRWEGPIAPPPLVGGDTLVGDDEVTDLDPDTRALLKGDPPRGVHAFCSASARERWAPLRPGDAVLVHAGGDRRTWGQVRSRPEDVACALVDAGVGPGAAVAVRASCGSRGGRPR